MEFGILGPLVVWNEGDELVLGGAKQRALLALLLLHANEPVPSTTLVDELWGERPPATAAKAVQVYVSQLRKALGDGVVETRRTGYVLRLAPEALDLHRFESLFEQGRAMLAAGATEESAKVLREALDLWRGPALADFRYDVFARDEIGRLEGLHLVALEQRLEADLALGRSAEVVGELEALVRAHPGRENLRELLMLALYRSGRQADALAAYQDTRVMLVDDLGLEPSASLQRLERAILAHDPSLDLAAASTHSSPRRAAFSPPAVDTEIEARKTVTLVFCDISAETTLGDRLDAESMRLVMARYFEYAAAPLERHGARVEKFVGGELLAVFGVPAVREDDAFRAVRAASELRRQVASLEAELADEVRLQVRIGINTGEVFVGDPAAGHGSVTGDPVAIGKRLEEAAALGEIVLGEETYKLVAHAVAATPLEPLKLHDNGRRVTLFRLESVDAEARALPYRDDAPLVGREDMLARLGRVYAQVAAREGSRLVTVVGEPGIGKSRLVRELVSRLATRATVLVGRCPPYGEGITFWPLRELFRKLGHGEEELAGSSREVFAATRRILEELAVERPVVAVFDDVQWGEPTFLDLVEYLAARLGDARVLLLCLARPELAEQRPNWLQEPSTALSLGPLKEGDSDTLLSVLGAPVAVRLQIARAAEGNPFFVEQLAAIADPHSAASPMPASIRSVLQERLDRLEAPERLVLELASVAGRSFSLDAVVDLTAQEERENVEARLLALARKRLVEPDASTSDEGFRFRHALIRDAVYDGIPKGVRADLHERVAAQLEAQSADDALVGHHLEQAFLSRRDLGRLDVVLGTRAGRRLQAGGRRAFRHSDVPATISLLERARAVLPEDDPSQPKLLIELGDARLETGDIPGALEDYDDAIEAAQRLGDRAAELHALIQRQYVRSFSVPGHTGDDAVRLALESLPELELLGDERALERAWFLKGYGDYVASRWRESANALEEAVRHARRGDAFLGGGTSPLGFLAVTLVYGPIPVPDAIARVEQELQLATGDRALEAFLGEFLASLFAMQGRLEDARRLYSAAIATYEELDLRFRLITSNQIGAQIELLAGDEDAAERELRVGAERNDAVGSRGFGAVLRARLARLCITQGRLVEAEALAREVSKAAPEDEFYAQVLWRCALAGALTQRGATEEAERPVAEALSITEDVDCPELRVAALTAAAEFQVAQGQTAEGRLLLEEARQIMEAKGNLVALRSVEAALAELTPVAASDIQA
ncbi:MAG TPA: BTAD domain-containing putative transcriptional regulator [Gaiellaceae bacterium]